MIIETNNNLLNALNARAKEILAAYANDSRGNSQGAALWGKNPWLHATTHLTIYLDDGEVLLCVLSARAMSEDTKQPVMEEEYYFRRSRSDMYWTDLVDLDEQDQRGVVVDGVHYRLGPDRKDGRIKGYAGRRWEIEYFDGRPNVVTNDLWYQGRVPEKHRVLLPDNARFV